MKLKVHDRWFSKKPKEKKTPKPCAMNCGKLAKSTLSKYCVGCSEDRRQENVRIQSKKRYDRVRKNA